MPRRTTRFPEQQLSLEWTDAMRWADLPAEVRTELISELRAMLEHAAAGNPERRTDE